MTFLEWFQACKFHASFAGIRKYCVSSEVHFAQKIYSLTMLLKASAFCYSVELETARAKYFSFQQKINIRKQLIEYIRLVHSFWKYMISFHGYNLYLVTVPFFWWKLWPKLHHSNFWAWLHRLSFPFGKIQALMLDQKVSFGGAG